MGTNKSKIKTLGILKIPPENPKRFNGFLILFLGHVILLLSNGHPPTLPNKPPAISTSPSPAGFTKNGGKNVTFLEILMGQ